MLSHDVLHAAGLSVTGSERASCELAAGAIQRTVGQQDAAEFMTVLLGSGVKWPFDTKPLRLLDLTFEPSNSEVSKCSSWKYFFLVHFSFLIKKKELLLTSPLLLQSRYESVAAPPTSPLPLTY